MLVLNVSGYKTGGTWLFNILKAGLKQPFKTDVNDIEADRESSFFQSMGVKCSPADLELMKKINAVNSDEETTRMLKLHLYSQNMSAVDFFSSIPAKYLLVRRDIRDVIVSRYFHESVSRFSGDFSQFLSEAGKGLLREQILYNRFWVKVATANASVLELNYTDLKSDYNNELLRIEDFLGKHCFNAKSATSMYSIEANRKVNSEGWMKVFKENGTDFYRKGEVGDYKNFFKAEEEQVFSEWTDELIAEYSGNCVKE